MKTHVLLGERIGREAKLRLGCSAVIFNDNKQVLLTRRSDNGQWCLPGGAMEPGENVAEACAREVWEETGLQIDVLRLIGIYSDPHRVIVYPDGNKIHIVALSFEAKATGGELGLSNETTEFGYFSLEEAMQMDIIGNHLERVHDALLGEQAALIK
jgi:8-oxo-dGTP pyrophosphatase MutT (NUDIX family)